MRFISNQGNRINTTTSRKAVVTIGNFDGCHSGHQQLIHTAYRYAKAHDLNLTMLTFDPHPYHFFSGSEVGPRSILTNPQKAAIASSIGVETFVSQTFDQSFSELSSESFLNDYLINGLHASAVVVGPDFTFGNQCTGNVDALKRAFGSNAIIVEHKIVQGERVSSSLVRKNLLHLGDVATARKLLGRSFALDGRVIRGHARGRTIGIPTLNIGKTSQIVPATGVYSCWLDFVDSRTPMPSLIMPQGFPAVMNIGNRPTFEENGGRSIEVHLIDHTLPLDMQIDHSVRLYFHERIRGEEKFSSADALVARIKQDILTGRSQLS
jgi:riboflavin kinase/FMN adenylyltransferase